MLSYLQTLYDMRPAKGAWEYQQTPPAQDGRGAPESDPRANRAHRTKAADDDYLTYTYTPSFVNLLPTDDERPDIDVEEEEEKDAARTPRLFIDLSEFTAKRTMVAEPHSPRQDKGGRDGWKALPASKLGEYTVIKDIAEGTFGKVKMAKHTITGHTVAMKFLSKEVIHREKTKSRVQREVEYMRALRHPHIIKLYEVISTPTHIVIVLEYAGGELFNYIVQHGRMPETRARRFFQQLVSGVEYSHNLKIVHRDLKPENVLLDNDLNVKIADFGLSSEITDGNFLKTSCGSPNYAAPEVIRGGLYTGPEIDIWSCGVILYVMLCGRLPFEDDDVPTLFNKISQGHFHTPSYMSSEAKQLISAMLVVDPVKRITIPEITQHPFYTKDLPRYLTPLPPGPGPIIGPLATLVTAPQVLDFEIIDGLGRIEEDVIDQLSSRMVGIDKADIWEALRRDDGVQGNSIKVAYLLLRDKNRLGRNLADFEEAERDAQLAAMDPRNNLLSPNALSPSGESENNPFESEFGPVDADDDEEYVDDGLLDFSTPAPDVSNFAVLNSSLPQSGDGTPASVGAVGTVIGGGAGSAGSGGGLPGEQHHLASYASARRGASAAAVHQSQTRERKQHRTKWHFGIRSRSPPMEVMLEIYRTLHTLNMEWKAKRRLGLLGGVRMPGDPRNITRAPEYDGGSVDLRSASAIYFVETRARVQGVVVLMNLQLYMVDSINYLVDFHHVKTYKASSEPGAGRFDMAVYDPSLSETSSMKDGVGIMDGRGEHFGEDEVVSPFVFMDVACRLILELAGGSE